MDRMEPLEPIDRIEPLDPMDRIEPLDPMDSSDPSVRESCLARVLAVATRAFSHRRRLRLCPGVGASSYASGMATFAVTMEHGPQWDPSRGIRAQAGFPEHAAFMDALVEDGFVLLGGPLDGGRSALLAVNAASEQAIRDRMADDPWAPAQLLRVGAVQRWELWLGNLTRTAGS